MSRRTFPGTTMQGVLHAHKCGIHYVIFEGIIDADDENGLLQS